MIRALKNAPLAGVFLSLAALAGCSVTQPVAETTARAVVTQLPGSFEKMGARQFCREHAAVAHGQETEAALIYRAETLQLADRLKAMLDRREAVAGRDLTELNAGLAEHLALRRQLYRMAEAYECWLDANGPAGKAEAILQALRQMGKRYDFNFDVETRDRLAVPNSCITPTAPSTGRRAGGWGDRSSSRTTSWRAPSTGRSSW